MKRKSSYSVTVGVSDGDNWRQRYDHSCHDQVSQMSTKHLTSQRVAAATRAIAENTASDTDIGSAVAATDPDDDTLTYTLSGADAASFSINGTNGQLQTKAVLDYETQTSYTVTITVSDSELTDYH